MRTLLFILSALFLLSWDLSKRNTFTIYNEGTAYSFIYLSDSSKLEGDFNPNLIVGHTVITSTRISKTGLPISVFVDTVSFQIGSTDWEIYNDLINIHNLTPR